VPYPPGTQVLLKIVVFRYPVSSVVHLPVAVRADRAHPMGVIRAAIEEPARVMGFKVG
jgi:hypothetical protein